MMTPITIPRLGWTMDEGLFAGWIKQSGEQVRAGEPLFNLESDKAVQEVECLDSGILQIPADAPKTGDKVRVGSVIGFLVQPGEIAPTSIRVNEVESLRPAPPEATGVGRGPEVPGGDPAQDAPAISPRASRLALELGVDGTKLRGSGRGGRITEQDVRAAAPSRSEEPSGEAPPVGPLRRTIAERMLTSARSTAAVTLTTSLHADNLVAARARLKTAAGADGAPPSYTDLLVKLSAAALRDHPALNAGWDGERRLPSSAINIGIAVDTPDGLLVPVLRDVPGLALPQLAARSRELVERARHRKLSAEELQGGTFTVTNLGAFGIDAFTPIINYPQCAILGVGRIERQAVVREDRVVPGHRLTLSLTFDHRVVDGAPAARFLQALTRLIQDFDPFQEL